MNEEITLEQLIKGLKEIIFSITKKWKLILIFTIIGSIVGFIYAYNTSPLYIAEMKILVKENKPTTFNGLVASDLGLNVINNENSEIFSKANFKDFVKSRKIIDKTLLKEVNISNKKIILGDKFLNTYIPKSKLFSFNKTKFNNNYEKWKYNRYRDSVLNVLFDIINDKCLKINNNNTQIFRIQMNTMNEGLSLTFLKNLSLVINDEYNNYKINRIKTLKQEIDSINLEINSLPKNPLDYNLSNKLSQNHNNNIISDRILSELIQELELTKFNLIKNYSFIEIIDESKYPLKEIKPNRIYNSLIGGMIGIILVFILILIKYTMNRFIKSK